MAREIPGFVYDEEKGKYFRVQENHQHTQHVALRKAPDREEPVGPTWPPPATTAYTREAVEGRNRLRPDSVSMKQQKSKQEHPGPGKTTFRSTRYFRNEIDLQLRLRTRPFRHPGALTDVGSLIRERYATSLQSRALSQPGMIGMSGVFTIDPSTRALFTATRLHRNRPEEFCVTPLSPSPHSSQKSQKSRHIAGAPVGQQYQHTYATSTTTPIFDSFPLNTAIVLSPACVVWTTAEQVYPGPHPESTVINISTQFSSLGLNAPWHQYRDQYGEWGTQSHSIFRGGRIFAAAAAPVGAHSGKVPNVIFASNTGVMMRDAIGAYDYVAVSKPSWVSDGLSVTPRVNGREGDRDFYAQDGEEVVSVCWKDEWVWLAGRRDGRVLLGDTRIPDSVVNRLEVGHGGASRVTGLGKGLDWGVLAWGLQSAGVYDLRYCKEVPTEVPPPQTDTESDSPSFTGSSHSRNAEQPRRGLSKSPQKHKRPKLPHPARTTSPRNQRPLTKSLLPMSIPTNYQQRQYRMGWAYSPSQSIVAAAYPTYLGGSKVALWDVRSGQMLPERGELGGRMFKDLVTCVQFVELDAVGDGGVVEWGGDGGDFGGAGLETLVLATEGKLEAWDV